MNDTQWPRYQVFLQEKEGEPHQDAGSVHAPDPEMALLNARDVFVRRPECVSLWVVPAQAIFSRTAEEQKEQGRELSSPSGGGSGGEGELESTTNAGANELYYVFCKVRPAGTQTMVGQLEASTGEEALQRAVVKFSGRQTAPGEPRIPAAAPFTWWVFPAQMVLRSGPQDIESMFSPALKKSFRLSTGFHTVTAMREIKTPEPKQPAADHSAQTAPDSGSTTGNP